MRRDDCDLVWFIGNFYENIFVTGTVAKRRLLNEEKSVMEDDLDKK